MCTSKVYVSLRKHHESVVSYVSGLLFHWYFMHVKKTFKISLHATRSHSIKLNSKLHSKCHYGTTTHNSLHKAVDPALTIFIGGAKVDRYCV